MLKQRILTAIVLLAVLTAALLVASPWPFLVLLTLAATLACWEWLRMTATPKLAVWLSAALFIALLALAHVALRDVLAMGEPTAIPNWLAVTFSLLTLVSLTWLVVVPVMVLRARVTAPAQSALLSAFAVLALATAWFALAAMFITRGAWYLVSLLALVWVADIAAYFAGKRWGRHKLAAAVSPGKSVEGALAGIVAGVAWMLASGQFAGSAGHWLLAGRGVTVTVVLTILLVNASILGDLFESLLKRRAGLKDSSGLLPGHGGVWDRIDAILPVAPLALLTVG